MSISGNKGEVLYFDKTKNDWVPAAKGGISRVDIFQDKDSYRIVGMTAKVPRQVVINSSITSNFLFAKATPLFIQFEDFDIQFGIKFANQEEADSFCADLEKTIQTLKSLTSKQIKSVPNNTPVANNTNIVKPPTATINTNPGLKSKKKKQKTNFFNFLINLISLKRKI